MYQYIDISLSLYQYIYTYTLYTYVYIDTSSALISDLFFEDGDVWTLLRYQF